MIFRTSKYFTGTIGPKFAPWLLAGFALLGGLVLTAVLWRNVQHDEADNLRTEFEYSADMTASNILSRINSYEMVVRGVQAFFEGWKP